MLYSRGVFLNVFNHNPTDWQRQLRRIDSLKGLGHIEVLLEYLPKGRQLAGLKSLLKNRRLIVHGPFMDVNLTSHSKLQREASLQRVADGVKVATELGAELVTVHSGHYPFFEGKLGAQNRLADSLKQLMSIGQPVITIENSPWRGGIDKKTAAHLRDLLHIRSSVSGLKFTLDLGHAILNDDDYLKFIKSHSVAVANIHLHDAFAKGPDHLRLGIAELKLQKLLNTLKYASYSGFVTLETIGWADTKASWQLWNQAELTT